MSPDRTCELANSHLHRFKVGDTLPAEVDPVSLPGRYVSLGAGGDDGPGGLGEGAGAAAALDRGGIVGLVREFLNVPW